MVVGTTATATCRTGDVMSVCLCYSATIRLIEPRLGSVDTTV